MKFSINEFFSKCDQIRRKMRIWSKLRKIYLWKISFSVQQYEKEFTIFVKYFSKVFSSLTNTYYGTCFGNSSRLKAVH